MSMAISVQPEWKLDLDEGAIIVAGTRASRRLAVAVGPRLVPIRGSVGSTRE